MRKFSKIFGEVLLSLSVVFLLLEITLRLFPQLIPLSILLDFNKDLRTRIAERRDLETEDDFFPAERDDGGPPLRFYKPYTTITYPIEDVESEKTVTMDDTGFCNPPDDPYQRAAIEMVTIGDSFTWCTTVDPAQTWTHRLGATVGASVYNLGAPGRGLYEYLQALKKFGLQKNPRVVVMAVFEGNDLRDALHFVSYKEKLTSGAVREGEEPCSLPRYLCAAYRPLKYGWVGRSSYAFNVSINAARYGKSWVTNIFTKEDFSGGGEAFDNFRYRIAGPDGSEIKFNVENMDPDEPYYAQGLKDGAVSLDVYADALKSFAETAKSHHFTPVVIYIPSAHTAYREHLSFEDAALYSPMAWFSNEQRRYFRTNAAIGYLFIDLTDHFKAISKNFRTREHLLYFPTNLHLTARGHEEIAKYIAPAIRKLKMTSR